MRQLEALAQALTFILTPALFFYFTPLRAHAAAGDLDSFGVGGKVVTDVSQTPDPFNPDSAEEAAQDVAIQPDGKIIAVGFAINPANNTSDFAVIRYNPDGSLDRSFGIGGQVLTDFNHSTDIAFAIALQAEKIVVAGLASTPNLVRTFAVARYTSNGELDQSFGTAGKVMVFFNKNFKNGESFGPLVDSMIWDVAIQSDGKIVLAGDTDAKFGFARLNPVDGSLDLTFGTGGKTIFSLGERRGGSAAYSVATQIVDSEERIVAAGYAGTVRGVIDFALMRLRSDGTPDLTFGSQGKVITAFSRGEDFANDLVIDGSNRIVAAGYSSPNFAIARYNVDGSLDLTFDGDGKVTTDFFGFIDQGNSVAIQPDGKMVVAGFTCTFCSPDSSSVDFALARYNSNGSLDNSFGANGKLITDFSGQNAAASALALQPDSKVVLLGTTFTDVARSFALARYLLE